MRFVFKRVDNTTGIRNINACYLHFLLFYHNVFKRLLSKLWLCGKELALNKIIDNIQDTNKKHLLRASDLRCTHTKWCKISKKWHTTFQGNTPIRRILFGREYILTSIKSWKFILFSIPEDISSHVPKVEVECWCNVFVWIRNRSAQIAITIKSNWSDWLKTPMFICPDRPRNASENGFEEEIIHRRFVVFHQNFRRTSYTGLSTNDRFNLLHGLVFFSKLIPISLSTSGLSRITFKWFSNRCESMSANIFNI